MAEKTTIFIDKEKQQQLKVVAQATGTNMTEVLDKIIDNFLSQSNVRKIVKNWDAVDLDKLI